MWVPSHAGITSNEKADKTADITTREILYHTITDIP